MANEDKFAKTIDDEELDEVAGGKNSETAKDFKFIKDLFPNAQINYNEVKSAFLEELGINIGIDKDEKNRYYKGNKEISRNDALIYAMRATGKYLDLEKYI